MEQHRRRMPRQTAGWRGLCLIEGESPMGWRDCRVIDISMLGLGITLRYPQTSELVGRGLSVEVPALGDTVKIRFEGKIRNVAAPISGGTVRVGIEFAALAEAERATTAVVTVMA